MNEVLQKITEIENNYKLTKPIINYLNKYKDIISCRFEAKTKNDIKRIKICKKIYRYIESNSGCNITDLAKHFEGKYTFITIKRYLNQMQKTILPYIYKKGKARATKYYVWEVNSFDGEKNIKSYDEFIRNTIHFYLKNEDFEGHKRFLKGIEKIPTWFRRIQSNGNNTIVLFQQKQYSKNQKEEKRSNSSKIKKELKMPTLNINDFKILEREETNKTNRLREIKSKIKK